jgi:hypothetical protein
MKDLQQIPTIPRYGTDFIAKLKNHYLPGRLFA